MLIIALAAASYHFPTSVSAVFEYFGREILHRRIPYRDMLDNKLPAVYYVNALWQLLFGSNYGLHWAAEATVVLASAALFAYVAKSEGLRYWSAATLVFALAASIPTISSYNYTEQYASFLILAAFAAIPRLGTAPSAAVLGLATFFWIPSSLQLLPLLWRARTWSARAAAAMAFCATVIALVGLCYLIVGGSALHELGGLMRSYERARFAIYFSGRTVLVNFLMGFFGSGFALLAAAFALAIRKPVAPQQRFGLLWSACAVAGAFVNGSFLQHYFLPAIAPFVFTTFALGISARALRARWLVPAMALAITPLIFAWMRDSWIFSSARAGQQLGHLLGEALPGDARILSVAYLPGVYLAADRTAPGRFVIRPDLFAGRVEPALADAYDRDARRASAIVWDPALKGRYPALSNLLRRDFARVCVTTATRWELFVLPALAARFRDCP